MPRLEEQEPQKLYYFRSDSGRRMQKFSGDEISESDIRLFEIPDFLIEQPPKNKEKQWNKKK